MSAIIEYSPLNNSSGASKGILYRWIATTGGGVFGECLAFTVTWLCGAVWFCGRALNILNFAILIVELPPLKEIGAEMIVEKILCQQWFHIEILLGLLETLLALPRSRTMGALIVSTISVWFGLWIR